MTTFRLKRFSIEDGGYSGNKRTVASGGIGKAAAIGGGLSALVGGLATRNIGGALGFGAIGAGVSALFKYLSNVADESSFNKSLSSSCNSYKIIEAIEDEFNVNELDPEEDEVTTSSTETDENGRAVTVTRRRMHKKKQTLSPKDLMYSVDGDPNKHVISMLLQGNVLAVYINDPNSRELSMLNNILDNYCYQYRNADYSSHLAGKNKYVVDIKIIDGTESVVPLTLIKSGFKLNVLTGGKLGIQGRRR
jgi:hypothetical protein